MKISDVVYANFASLAYINWEGIKPGTPVKDAIFDIRKKGTKKLGILTRHLYMVYSEDEMNECPLWDKQFNEWRFLKSGNFNTMLKDNKLLPHFTMFEDIGFYALAVENDTDIIISFRGTDDIEDALNDLQLYTGTYSNQITAAYMFADKIINTYGFKKKIHLVGHSLGGALVQSLMCNSLIAPKIERAVTFNALGVKDMFEKWYEKGLGKIMMLNWMGWMGLQNTGSVINEIDKMCGLTRPRKAGSLLSSMISEMDIIGFIKNAAIANDLSGNNFNVMIEKDSKIFKNLKYQFGTVSSKKFEERMEDKPVPGAVNIGNGVKDVEVKAFVLYNALKFLNNLSIHRSYEEKIVNYIISKDIVGTALEQYGKTIAVDTGEEVKGVPRDVITIVKDRALIVVHGIGNFVAFMDNSGMLNYRVRKNILLNIVRDYMESNGKYAKMFEDPSIPSVKKQAADLIMNIPVEIGLDKSVESKYYFGYIYNKFMFGLILDNNGSEIRVGSYFNMKFDGIDGHKGVTVVKLV